MAQGYNTAIYVMLTVNFTHIYIYTYTHTHTHKYTHMEKMFTK